MREQNIRSYKSSLYFPINCPDVVTFVITTVSYQSGCAVFSQHSSSLVCHKYFAFLYNLRLEISLTYIGCQHSVVKICVRNKRTRRDCPVQGVVG